MSTYEVVNYQCNQCDEKFTAHGNLKRHQVSVHEGVKYQCDYKATLHQSLKKHKRSVHEGAKY